MTGFQRGATTRSRHRLLFARRASVTILVTCMLPVFLGFGLMAVGTGHLFYRKLLLTQTVSAATLAAASNLTTYYTSGNGSTATIVSAAQTFATANEPTARYGTVVPAADIVVGNWNSTTSTFTSLASSAGTMPNAVQVTGLNTAANGNAVPVFFGSLVGIPTKDMTVTAIASYATGQNFDTIILNDLSELFKSEITEQRAADNAILNCVESSSSSASTFGITTFDGHSSIYQALLQASTNLSSLESKINALNYCGQSGAPACSGSNVAAGIYSAIQQFRTRVSDEHHQEHHYHHRRRAERGSHRLYHGGRHLSHTGVAAPHLHRALLQCQSADDGAEPGIRRLCRRDQHFHHLLFRRHPYRPTSVVCRVPRHVEAGHRRLAGGTDSGNDLYSSWRFLFDDGVGTEAGQ